jgi:hypothetical protein
MNQKGPQARQLHAQPAVSDGTTSRWRHLPPACGRRRRPGGGAVLRKDCALCNLLCEKLCAVTGAFGMAEVCKVPTTWIFLRPGRQGAESVSVACRGRLRDPRSGRRTRREIPRALVLEPETGVYMDDRRRVGLRCTSSMISVNLSHDTLLPPGDEGQALKRALASRRVGGLLSSPMRTV